VEKIAIFFTYTHLIIKNNHVQTISFTSFIHSRIYKAPLQEVYSEAPPAQLRQYRSVLSNLQKALSLLLGRRLTSKGSPLQVDGPTMENARCCLVAVLALAGQQQRNEGLAIQVDQIQVYRACRDKEGHYQEDTARPKQLSYKRCGEQLGANAACHAYKQKQKHISENAPNETGGTAKNPIKMGS